MKMLNHYSKNMELKCQCIVMNGGRIYDKDGNVLESIDIDKNKASEYLIW